MRKKTKSDIERLEILIQEKEDQLAECTDPTKIRKIESDLHILEVRMEDLIHKYS